MINDTVSDMVIRIKNAYMVGRPELSMPYTKICEGVARVMLAERYLMGVEVKGEGVEKTLYLKLQYVGNKPAVGQIRRISKPGVRLYSGARALKPVLSGMGISILSTSKGIMTGRDARKANVGGEVLCELW